MDTDSAAQADDRVHIHATVTGLVQGVGFRYFTVMTARDIGVGGWVRNCHDGSVEVDAQGTRAHIAQLLSALKAGPKWSQVEHVAVEQLPVNTDISTAFRVFQER